MLRRSIEFERDGEFWDIRPRTLIAGGFLTVGLGFALGYGASFPGSGTDQASRTQHLIDMAADDGFDHIDLESGHADERHPMITIWTDGCPMSATLTVDQDDITVYQINAAYKTTYDNGYGGQVNDPANKEVANQEEFARIYGEQPCDKFQTQFGP